MADEIEGVPHHVRMENLDGGITRLWVKDRHVDLTNLESYVLGRRILLLAPFSAHDEPHRVLQQSAEGVQLWQHGTDGSGWTELFRMCADCSAKYAAALAGDPHAVAAEPRPESVASEHPAESPTAGPAEELRSPAGTAAGSPGSPATQAPGG